MNWKDVLTDRMRTEAQDRTDRRTGRRTDRRAGRRTDRRASRRTGGGCTEGLKEGQACRRKERGMDKTSSEGIGE